MNPDTRVVLDACVLIPMPLADTLLRLAEEPRLYVPKWSDEILDEVSRNIAGPPWHLQPKSITRRIRSMNDAFPDATVPADPKLTAQVTNDPKDRHVLATAVRAKASVIVTYDRRGFESKALNPWGVSAVAPSSFLIAAYESEPAIVEDKLTRQAADIGMSRSDLLSRLQANVPAFVNFLKTSAR
jgi:predicted nucleic acid-binding protein